MLQEIFRKIFKKFADRKIIDNKIKKVKKSLYQEILMQFVINFSEIIRKFG